MVWRAASTADVQVYLHLHKALMYNDQAIA
jgi:hypothetical protein